MKKYLALIMKNNFKDKVVWITGASSGIGEELAYEFSIQGAKLILSARNERELNRVRQNCEGNLDDIFILPLDLLHGDEISEKTKLALSKFGCIDILIHNAGIASRDLVQNTGLNIDRAIMETNYFGAIALTKSILPSMMNFRSGHIVVISSLSGKYGVPRLSAYAASKHALHGFFDSLRGEVRNHGIKISIIIPGFINTLIIKNAVDGNGIRNGKNMSVNEHGMSPKTCALKIIKIIKNGKQEALIGRFEILSVYLNRFFPKLFRTILSNHPMRKLRLYIPFLFK